jgi:hypothetical protein
VIGHGVQADGRFFCCAHCAQAVGTGAALRDRADESQAAGNAR